MALLRLRLSDEPGDLAEHVAGHGQRHVGLADGNALQALGFGQGKVH